MNEQSLKQKERYATQQLLSFVERNQGGLPVRVVAGSLMRTGVALAIELLGPQQGKEACRQALEKILSDYDEPRRYLQ